MRNEKETYSKGLSTIEETTCKGSDYSGKGFWWKEINFLFLS